MKMFKKTLATVFAILFVGSAVFALIFFNFSRKAFTAETYKRVLANEGFYDRLPAVLAEATTSGRVDETELPLVLRGMSTAAWEAFFSSLLPEQALTAMGDEALDSVFAYLSMESDSAQISLLHLKRTMTGDAGVTAIYTLLDSQPDCTLIQVAQMTFNLLNAEDIQYCNPPAELHSLLTPAIEAVMEVTAFLLPDQITLVSAERVLPEEDPRARLQNIRTLMRLAPIVPLGFLLLLTIFAVNSLNSWLDWWGYSFLATGLIATLMGVIGAPVMGRLLKRSITLRATTYLPQVLSDYASDLAAALLNAVLKPVLWQGILLAVFGASMVVLSKYLANKSRTVNKDPAEEQTII